MAIRSRLFSLALVFALTVAGCAASPQPAGSTRTETIRWKWVVTSSVTPEAEILKRFITKVDERTKGGLKIDMLSLPQLGLTGFEMVKVLKGGVVDMAEVLPGYISGDFPLIEGFELPGMYPSSDASIKGTDAWINATQAKLAELTGSQRLFYFNNPPQVFCSKKALRTVADFRGVKVRTFSTAVADMGKALGMEPVTVPFAEAYTALDRGTVEAIMAGVSACESIKLYEIAKYVVTFKNRAGFLNPSAIEMVNNKSFEALPDAYKTAVRQSATELQEEFTSTRNARWEANYKALKDKGMEIIESSPEVDAALVAAARQTVVPSWIARAGPEGKTMFNQILGPIVGFTVP